MMEQEAVGTLVHQTLKLASAKGEAVARASKVLRHQLHISNSEIDTYKQWNFTNLEVFVTFDGRIGTTDILNPTPALVKKKVKELITFVEGLHPTPLFSGLQNEIKPPSKVKQLYDKRVRDFPEKAPELTQAALDEAQKAGAKRTAGSFFFEESSIYQQTSHGFSGEYKESSYQITLRSFIDGESSGQGLTVGRNFGNIEKELVHAGRESGEIAALAVGGKQGKPGIYDLVMHPTVAASILGTLVNAANPLQIMLGLSPLKDKVGEQLGPESFTVWDDGRIPNGLASLPFDFEGTPTQRTTIFNQGTLRGLIHNVSSAKMFESQSTGNCVLADMGVGSKLIVPGPTNFVFQAGDASYEELLAPARPTIYVTSNWYLRFTNQLEGTFSTIPRDGMFLIEKGAIGKPIQKLRIADNLLRMIGAIEGIGRELRQIKWWEVETPTFIPFIRIKDVPMTAATQ